MAATFILLFCASSLLAKTAIAQCIGRSGIIGMSYDIAYASPITQYGYGCGDITAAYGGGLSITSSSPIAPTGIVVNSENAIDGTVAVIGNLPFLGSVAVEGVFPTTGAGAVSYGCGDGYIGIISELPGYAGAASVGIAPGIASIGYDYGVAPYGVGPCGVPIATCGYGSFY